MADEKSKPAKDEGHKFVDKRRVSESVETEPAAISPEESSPPPTEAAVSETPAEPVTSEQEIEDDGFPGMDGVFGIASYAIGLLSMSAWQYLGLVADPKSGKAQRDLKQARIAIDCVAGMVDALDKNGGVVDAKTMGDLKRVLNDLRLNFVTQSNMSASGN